MSETVTVAGGGSTAAAICSEHLALLRHDADGELGCHIDAGAPEPVVQAVTGLMTVHGRDRGIPRRLGVDAASVATGILACQGILAGLLAGRRGVPVAAVEVSGFSGALMYLTHHLAIATSGGVFPYRPAEGTGPPFATADGHWVEIEVLSGDDWFAFWQRLGVTGADVVGRAWLPFVYRYLAGRCALPAQLHAAVARHTLAQVRAAAGTRAAVSPVRIHPLPSPALPWKIQPHTGAARATTMPADLAAEPSIDAPLGGLRVVEVTSRLQGPLAGLLLRLLGADVVKVEPPGGDFGRLSPPLAGDTGAAYLAYNRGKRVIEIDYKRPSGRAELADLAAGADVFLHNWRPGRAESLGLDATDIAARNPAVVYAYASGWGDADDPPSPIAGDFIVQAYAGCGAALNPPDEPPLPSRLTLLDVTGGLLACEGILAGLYQRERTGLGCRVDTSLVAAAVALHRQTLRRWGPLDRPLPTAAGDLVVSDDPDSRRHLRTACGLPASATDAQIASRIRERTAAQWLPLLRAYGVAAACPRTGLSELPADPRLAGLLERAGNACWVPGPPWRFIPEQEVT